MSETPANYGNEPESVRIDRALTGLQQSVDSLAAFMRKVHGIEAPETKHLSAEERLGLLKEIGNAFHLIEGFTMQEHTLRVLEEIRPTLETLLEDASKPE